MASSSSPVSRLSFARCPLSFSPSFFFSKDGVRLKRYRGMGSIDAMQSGSEKRYNWTGKAAVKVAQGVSGSVVDKGSLKRYIPYLLQVTLNLTLSGHSAPSPHAWHFWLLLRLTPPPWPSCLAWVAQGVRHGLQDMGAASVTEMHGMLYSGALRLELRSPAAQREGGVHGLHTFEKRLFA